MTRPVNVLVAPRMPEPYGPPLLLVAGNRTSVFLERGAAGERIRKQLRNFADVKSERSALFHEASMQLLAAGPGVVPVLGGQLTGTIQAHLPTGDAGEFRVLFRPYLHGHSLRELLSHGAPDAQFLCDNALLWLGQLAIVLARIHALRDDHGATYGLIHRDVTPDNVLLDVNQRIWLNDFGLAHSCARGEVRDDQLLQGSRPFLPPELAWGEQPTERSDVYQAALLTAVLLDTTRLVRFPHTLEGAQALARDPALPGEVRAALALDPDNRPSSAQLARSLA